MTVAPGVSRRTDPMRVVITGAGSVGRSIARELIENGHSVLLVDRVPEIVQRANVEGAQWLLADACEIAALHEAGLEHADVVVAATGDDKANLVVSLLAKTEFGVPRTVARVNNPKNEWMFDEAWGVDVAVSTPRLMTALVEEAVSVGDLVRIFQFQQGHATMVGLTLPDISPYVGQRVGDVDWPPDTVLVSIIREDRPIAPSPDDALEAHDELLILTVPESEDIIEALLAPEQHHRAHP
jgi:trk system potassium uptake protein TrkA